MEKPSQTVKVHRFRAGHWETAETCMIAEQMVSLTVNGKVWLAFMCTPEDLEALAVGFLYNENIISSAGEIASLRVCPAGDNVDVWLNQSVQDPISWRRTSGCTGGFSPVNQLESMPPRQHGIERMGEFTLTPSQIGGLLHLLFESQDLYRQSGGVHISALSDGKEILISAEDIGRHNTLDKIAGRCLLNSINPSGWVLLTTGRVSSEMLQKAIRLDVSVVISRTSPSDLSVGLADRYGITLIGYARRDSFTIYAHPERVAPGLDMNIPEKT